MKNEDPIEESSFLHLFVIFSTSRCTIVHLRVEENAILHHSQKPTYVNTNSLFNEFYFVSVRFKM